MNKNEKPKLKLNKRTVANLNNMEMRYVRGGDGDDEGPSRKLCDVNDPDVVSKILKDVQKVTISHLILC